MREKPITNKLWHSHKIKAPAKVNLYLNVTGKRPDGYHLIDSLIVFADACDELTITPDDNFSIEVNGPFADKVDREDNTIAKAFALLRGRFQLPGCKITLEKNLPVGGGIGGGSADAAAAILALKEIFGLDIAGQELLDLALNIGADVPVCLKRRACYAEGIGEVITETEIPGINLLLVNPGIEVPTKEIFKMGFKKFSGAAEKISLTNSSQLIDFLKANNNDLAGNAVIFAPQIGEVISLIRSQPECLLARMSGSGSTCFGIFGSMEAAAAAALRISGIKKGWWIKPASLFRK